jgi:uncharacterized glyoxalase superfamily protein PhnB
MPELSDLELERALRDLPRPAFKERLRKSMQTETVVPYITTNRFEEVVQFAKDVLGAEELLRATGSAGGTHCELRIGDAKIMIGGGVPRPMREMPTMLHVYVPDVDATYRRAIEAGGKSLMAPVDQEYGDRDSGVEDPAGNQWCFATSRGDDYKPAMLRTVTVYLHPHGVRELVGFLEQALDAKTLERYESPDGVVQHAKVQVGNSVLEMGEAHGAWQPMPTMFHVSVANADQAYQRAVAAGARSLSAPADKPHGARMASVEDPTGNEWHFASPLQK